MAVGVTEILNWGRYNSRIRSALLREIIGELLATFIFCLIVVAGTCNMNANTFNILNNTFQYQPTLTTIPVAFGYFITTLLFGNVSGAHVNPATSLALAIAGRLSWIKLHAYIFVQFVGGYFGSLLGFALFQSYIGRAVHRTPGSLQDVPNSAALFNATPGWITLGAGFANEIVITAIFIMCLLSIKDLWNNRSTRYVQGILIGLVVLGLGTAFGQTTGVAINPVRDLCPRLACLSFGWSSDAAIRGVVGGNAWAVGLFAPLIGAILGAFLYIFIIGSQLNFKEDDNTGPRLTPSKNDMAVPYDGVENGDLGGDWRTTVIAPNPPSQELRMVPHIRTHSPMFNSPYPNQTRVQFQH